ncbi:MAG: hypothetical protein ACRDKT_13085 [Actinomycetota bacterium]
MSRSATRSDRLDTTPRSNASARLGLTLRSVLLTPRDGFAAALKAAERRARAGSRPAEGLSPYVLAAIGGASLMMLWLKLGALLGLREVCTADNITAYIVASLVLGAVLGLIAQAVWGGVGPRAMRGLHTEVAGRDLRLVWGASNFPQVFALVLLLPLDLAIVGTDTFTTAKLGDSLATAWAAFSIALAISVALWSLFLFVRGLEVAGGIGMKKALLATLMGLACLAVVVGVLVFGASFLPRGNGCPTQLG